MLLKITKVIHERYYSEGAYGKDPERMFIQFAVVVSQAEGKPTTAHKIAQYLGMPRSSVIRKLAELERRGLVVRMNSHYRVGGSKIGRSDADKFVARLVRIMALTMQEIEKLRIDAPFNGSRSSRRRSKE
jgi:DNA-binding transcriptional ArsR family regulator